MDLSDKIYFPDKCIPFLSQGNTFLFMCHLWMENAVRFTFARMTNRPKERCILGWRNLGGLTSFSAFSIFTFVLHTTNEFLVIDNLLRNFYERDRRLFHLRTNILKQTFFESNILKSFCKFQRMRNQTKIQSSRDAERTFETIFQANFGRQLRRAL